MKRAARRKESRRLAREQRNQSSNVYRIDRKNNSEPFEEFENAGSWQLSAKDLKPKNAEQSRYINTIKNSVVTVGTGEPGTGKTFVPAVLGVQEILSAQSDIEHMILIRPNEPLGKSLGMLPGDLASKLEPWLEPIADGVKWAIGDTKNGKMFKSLVERGVIQHLAIEHARGRTFNNAFVILDEAQNVSVEAMMCILTRIGQDCRLVICGDINQKDIKSDSGLGLLMQIHEEYDYVPFQLVELTQNVRSPESKAFHAIFKDMGLVQ